MHLHYNLVKIFDYFGGLLDGQPLCPPPQPIPHTRLTPYPTPNPAPNPREFDLFGYINNGLLSVFDFENEGFEFENECEFYMNLKNFGGLFWVSLDGTLLVPIHDTTPSPRPTPYPTPATTPNPRKFDILGGESNVLLNVFEFENFLENEINVHFQDFENGM